MRKGLNMENIQGLKSQTFAIMTIAFVMFLTGCQMAKADRLTAVPFTDVAIGDEFWAPRIETSTV